MDILSLRIREDLRNYNQTMRAYWTTRWRWLQLLVLIFGLLVAIYMQLSPRWPMPQIVQLMLFAPFLLLTGMYPFVYPLKHRRLITGLLSFIYVMIAILAAYLNPSATAVQLILPAWTPWFNLLIPFLSWVIMLSLFHHFPSQARQYSLRAHDLPVNVLIGVGCGLAFSLHLYALSYFIPGLGLPMVQFTNMGLLWSVCVLLGMIVPAEELIFRGVAFSILHDELNYTLREVIVRVTALNVLVYLVIVAGGHVIHPYEVLLLVYRAGLSALSLYLVYHQRSLLPGMIANLIFSAAAGWLLFL